MRATAVRVTADGGIDPCAVEQALVGSREASGIFWIRIADYQVAELDTWLDQLNLTSFAKNRLLKQGEITKVVPISGGIILELRVLPADASAATGQMTFLRMENLVIQFDSNHQSESVPLDARVREFELMDASSTGMLLSALLFEAKRVSQEVRGLRSTVFELDEQMDRDPAGVNLDAILELKERLLRLFAVSEEQLDSLEALTSPGDELLDCSNLRGTVQLLLSVVGFSERLAERLEKRIADLRQRYDAHQQEKLNHRLAVLTVISAIFLPLTLVAGIWGMNFQRMPELAHPNGYAIALTLMAVIASAMLWMFRRKGWFG